MNEMKNLDDFKLKIPDWKQFLNVRVKQKSTDDIPVLNVSESEAKRFVARLVLLQITDYMELKIQDYSEDGWFCDKDDHEYFPHKENKYIITWLVTNHPEILEDYFK
jgi:hypothetical protein